MAQAGGKTALIVTGDPLTKYALEKICEGLDLQLEVANSMKESLVLLQCLFDLVLVGDDLDENDQRRIIDYVAQRWSLVTAIVKISVANPSATTPSGYDCELWIGTPQTEAAEILTSVLDRKGYGPERKFAAGAHVPFAEVRIQGYGTIVGRLRDVSRSGLFVSLPMSELPQIGSICQFRIDSSPGNWNAISGTGVVRWIRSKADDPKSAGIGIQFCTINESALTHLLSRLEEA